MEQLTKEQEIIKLLFKDFLTYHNSRTISKVIGISHAGAFKILKKLEKRDIVRPKRIGKAIIYSLNLENPITNKGIEMALVIEAQNFRRWVEEFKELEDHVRFVILFGSITRNEKEASDIDILIVINKGKYENVNKIIEKKQSILPKRIHSLIQIPKDFKHDINKKNKAVVEILKTGIILYGQEELRRIMKLK